MPYDAKAKPKKEYLREMLEYIQSGNAWGGLQKRLDDKRIEMYFDEDRVPQEDTQARGRRRKIQPERMTANELRREVDLITSLFPYPAEIGVQPIGEGSRGETIAERVEMALNEAIDQLNPPLDSPLMRERWQMCLLGRAARMIVPGHMYWWDFPYMSDGESLDDWDKRHGDWVQKAPLPVTWIDLPAESTFPPTLSRMDEELLSWQKVSGYDLCTMFSPKELGGLIEDNSEAYQSDYTLVIYSNQVWLCYAVMREYSEQPTELDKIIRSQEHGLGTPAIQITPGVVSGRKEPGRYWQGVSDASIALIEAANRRLSEASTASKFDALPMFKSWAQENGIFGEGANADNNINLSGDIIPLRPEMDGMGKEDIEPLFQPRYGEKTLAMAQFALARAERNSGAVEALEGATGPSGEPAWSRNSIIEQSKMKHSRLAQGVSAADVAAADQISRCIQAFGEDVYLTTQRGKGPKIVLRPDDLKDYRAVLKSEYKMKLPVSRRADIQLGVSVMEQAKRSGIPISPAWVMENVMDISQPMEEFKRSITWQLLQSEESMAFYKKLLVKESEMDLAQDEGMDMVELLELAESGQLPPQIAEQLAGLATGGNQLGNRGDRRAGVPFSTSPTGPQPQQEMPPASNAGVY